MSAVNDLESVTLNWVIIRILSCACLAFPFCMRMSVRVRTREREAVYCLQWSICSAWYRNLNRASASARLDAVGWAFDEVCRWSAWRPSNTASFPSSLAYNWCFGGIVPLRVPPKWREIGPCSFHDWTWSYSNEGKNAFSIPPEMVKNLISCQLFECVFVCVRTLTES